MKRPEQMNGLIRGAPIVLALLGAYGAILAVDHRSRANQEEIEDLRNMQRWFAEADRLLTPDEIYAKMVKEYGLLDREFFEEVVRRLEE